MANPTKEATRYRVTINGETRYRDTRPTDDETARIEEYIIHRGGHARIDECHTRIEPALVGTGRGVELRDRCLFELEG